jgi:hypothetical protein
MRWRLLAIVLLVAAQPAVALADGPSGSKEDKKTHQVKCGQGTDTPAGKVYAGSNGIEACSDNNSSPDGRVIISFAGQFIAVDGDPSNSAGTGFVRVDSSGVSCGGDAKKKWDSTAGPGGTCP